MSKKLTQEYIILKLKNDRIQTIKNINLWGNEFEDVSIIQQMPSLEIISLSLNKIRSLKPFANLNNLKELYLRKNMIGDINEIKYLTTCPNLRTLWLSENPISETRNYRAIVIRLLPGLIKLDDVIISDKEKSSIEYKYQQEEYRNYPQMRKQYSENAYHHNHNQNYDFNPNPYPSKIEHCPSYDMNHQEYPHDKGLRKQVPSYNNDYSNKAYNDDYNVGRRENKQSQDKYDYNNYYSNQPNEYKFDNKPQNIHSSRENKSNQNINGNNRISNVTNCLLMLLKELNTNELEYVKGEIDKKINK